MAVHVVPCLLWSCLWVFFTRYCKHDNFNLVLQRRNDDEKKEMEIKLQATNIVRL